MAFFNLFRKAESKVSEAIAPQSELLVNENVFVDQQPPLQKEATVLSSASLIEGFFRADYEQKGYNDGYIYPNGDLLDNKIKQLKTGFRLILDQTLDGKRKEIGDLQLHLIGTKGISERLEESLKERIKQLENIIHELDIQKVLSVEEEGIIAPVVQAYRIGFIKGVEHYNQEKLFAGSTRLF
ncbi:MAG: hypothetical protein EOP48_04510 [Sphingobacteriales bacterium]|nr:MAG: hypothetical protein EOP48_04510 [Sphingobacteriales bacterium]